jgi:energy-converting hydrogenase B subunit Q
VEHAVLVTLKDQPGTLFLLTKVLAEHHANISYVDIINRPAEAAQIYFEFDLEGSVIPIMDGFRMIPKVMKIESAPPSRRGSWQ